MRYFDRMNDLRLISRIRNLRKDPPFIIFQTLLDKATLNALQMRRFYFLLYNGVPSVRQLRGPGEVRRATPDDIAGMERLEDKRDIFTKRFAARDHCFVAQINGKIIGYEWVTDNAYHMEERYLYRITIPSDSIYAYDAYILPQYRMCGFWPRFKKHMAELMKDLRKDKILTMIDYENNISMNTHLRFGFIPFKQILVIRVLGRSFFRENRNPHVKHFKTI